MKDLSQIQFDFTGEQLRDSGISLAKETADFKSNGWSEMTYKLFKEWLKITNDPFLMEEFRSHLALNDDYCFPDNLRAFGFITPKAAKEGLIRQIGTRKVSNPKAHRANAAQWLKIN